MNTMNSTQHQNEMYNSSEYCGQVKKKKRVKKKKSKERRGGKKEGGRGEGEREGEGERVDRQTDTRNLNHIARFACFSPHPKGDKKNQ